MIECEFSYTQELLNKIKSNAIKKFNIFAEICLFIMLAGVVVLFVAGNNFMGAIILFIFVMLTIGMFVTNKTIANSNQSLLSQRTHVMFNDENMLVKTYLGDAELSTANIDYKAIKQVKIIKDLIYIYFNKTSALVVPKNSFKTNEICGKAVQLLTNNYVA